MEVGKLLSKWWFVGLVSLGIGGPLGYLALSLFTGGSLSSILQEMPFPSNVLMVALYLLMFGGYLISFLCLTLIVAPRHALDGKVQRDPDVLLRMGYEVRRRESSFDVRVGRLSTLRVYDEGRTFRCLPAPTVMWAMVLLSLSPPTVMFVFPLALFVQQGCWKGLVALPLRTLDATAPVERGVEEMVKDSLMRAYLLSREAAEIARSKSSDQSMILVIISLVAWTGLLVLSAPDLVAGRSLMMLGLGTLTIFVLTILGVLVLRKRIGKEVAKEEAWSSKLLSAMRSEKGEGSPIELLLDACQQVPRWLTVHRHGVWTREPGKTLLVFLLLVAGTNGFMSYGSIWWGFYIISAAFLVLGAYLLFSMTTKARFEARDLEREWEQRMLEMGSLLEPERGN